MEFRCPACQAHPVTLRDRQCPHCLAPLTLGPVLRLYGRRAKEGLRRATAIQCPACRAANPISARVCATCQQPITLEAVLAAPLRPVRQPIRSFLSRPPRSVSALVQLAYLALSVWALTILIGRAARTSLSVLAIGGGYSVVFLTAILLLVPWVFPRSMLLAAARWLTPVLRLALVANGLTLLLYSALTLGVNWTVPLAPAGALFVALLATEFLNKIWRDFQKLREHYREDSPMDPTKPQGRRGYRS